MLGHIHKDSDDPRAAAPPSRSCHRPTRGDMSEPRKQGPALSECRLTGATLDLVMRAYGVTESRIVGGRIGSQRAYSTSWPDIPKMDRGMLRLFLAMRRALLADQFKLRSHSETREMAAFVLSPVKNGYKIQPTAPGGSKRLTVGPRIVSGSAQPISALARVLAQLLGRPVVDETGLVGPYDFELTFAALQSDSGWARTPCRYRWC